MKNSNSYYLKFAKIRIRKKWVNWWVYTLNDKRIKILKAIYKDPYITKKQLKNIVGIGAIALDNDIAHLKGIILLERNGTMSGRWNIRSLVPKSG